MCDLHQATCFLYNYCLFLLVCALTLCSQNSSPIQKGYPNEKSLQVFISFNSPFDMQKEGNFSGKKEKRKTKETTWGPQHPATDNVRRK